MIYVIKCHPYKSDKPGKNIIGDCVKKYNHYRMQKYAKICKIIKTIFISKCIKRG